MPDSPPEPLYSFRGNMTSIHCILPIIREKNELIYVGTNSGCVHVWDLKLKREKIKHMVGSEACLCILFHKDVFLTQEKGNSIKFWNENSIGLWKVQKILNHDYCGFCKMVLVNNFIYLPSHGSKMIIYDFGKNREILQGGENNLGEIMCLRVIVSIECVLVCYESGEIILWSIDQTILYKTKITADCPMAIDYCELTKEGILGTNGNKLVKFVLNTENKTITLYGEAILTNPGVSSVVINDEGKLCIVGCWDSRIRYYTMKGLSLLAVLIHHSDSVDSITVVNKVLSFCGKGLVIAGGKDSRVSLWTLYTKSKELLVNNKK